MVRQKQERSDIPEPLGGSFQGEADEGGSVSRGWEEPSPQLQSLEDQLVDEISALEA